MKKSGQVLRCSFERRPMSMTKRSSPSLIFPIESSLKIDVEESRISRFRLGGSGDPHDPSAGDPGLCVILSKKSIAFHHCGQSSRFAISLPSCLFVNLNNPHIQCVSLGHSSQSTNVSDGLNHAAFLLVSSCHSLA